MPEEWRRSVLIPIYKNKGDAQCCGNYRGIKLMSHTMKVWERIIETRLRDRVEVSKQHYRFMTGKGTTDAMLALRMLMEKYREGQRELHYVFVDLEKAYDIVICEETRKEVEQRLEYWKYALERRGMKVSRTKTEYLCINGGNDDETVNMEDTKVSRIK